MAADPYESTGVTSVRSEFEPTSPPLRMAVFDPNPSGSDAPVVPWWRSHQNGSTYVSKVKSGGRLDYTGRIDNINRIWMRVGLLPSDFTTAGLPPIDSSVAVPREAAKPVLELLRDHELARAKPVDTARRLFTSAAPENADVIETLEPVVQHWIEVTNWFMKRAHDDGRCDEECPREELERQFALFEKTLMAIVRQFYTAVDELDQILEDANS
jgi:hypothetical protein